MWSSTRDARRSQLRRRLGAATSGWVPTVDAVRAELEGRPDLRPGTDTDPSAPSRAGWDAAAPPVLPRRVDRAALPAVVALAVGAVVGAAALWLVAWPRGTVAPASPSAGAAASPSDARSAAAPTPVPSGRPATVVVDVAGAVRRPGVVELPAGSRVTDALTAAGGALPRADTTPLNLARVLQDGEQVLVPTRGRSAGGVTSGGAAPDPGTAPPVDLNTASLEQLDALPGIGPVLAQRILDWRTANGGFSSVEQLSEVSGIGEATLAELVPLVRV